MTIDAYVRQVLDRYVSLTDTPERANRSDRALARSLFSDHMPLSLVLNSMLLATIRRHYRDPDLPPLEPIHSLHYFLPVIRYIEVNPLEPVYINYLNQKLRDIQHLNNPSQERTAP